MTFVLLGEDLDEDVREALTEEEGELRAYLLHGEPLSEDAMDKHTAQFWDTEPYKLVNGQLIITANPTKFHFKVYHISIQ